MTRVSVVTGAGRGMGRACAERLAEDFDVVVTVDINEEAATAAAEAMPDGKGRPFAGDVSSRASMQALAEFAGSLGDFVTLVHAAAISPSMATWDRLVEVDLVGTAYILEAFEPLIGPGASAICFSSCSAYLLPQIPDPEILAVLDEPLAPDLIAALTAIGDRGPAASSQSAYPWAKRAVQRLAARTAIEWGKKGARVVSISPGIIDTPQAQQELQESDFMKMMVASIPLARMGNSDEVAEFVAFLVSPKASYLSGIDVLIDGALMPGLNAAMAARSAQ